VLTTHATRLVGVLSHPVGENAIFDMLAAGADATECDSAFLQFDASAKDIADPVRALQTLGARGLYLTGRLRASASGLVDYLSDEAHGTGIINVITFDGDQATGHNTEARAMVALLEPYRDQLATGGAVILGGGAVARAAAYALIRSFRTRFVTIADRTLQQAQVLKQMFTGVKNESKVEAHELFPPDIADLLAEARVIINATSLGSSAAPEETPVTIPDIFSSRQIVLDTVHTPSTTRLLADAAASGAHTISGADLLARQCALAFELLTGVEFPEDAVKRVAG
jgi:shikimate 5-dehydrogenase